MTFSKATSRKMWDSYRALSLIKIETMCIRSKIELWLKQYRKLRGS